MKLLRAFIEASGYEIEEVKGEFIPTNFGGSCSIDYKVTKKQTETEYLLSSKANADRLEESIKQFKAGDVIEKDLF